jgi:hypothetical protein
VESNTGAIFYGINTQISYLCVQVGLTVIYTILVAYRLLAMRSKLKQTMGQYDSSTYDTIVLMVVESAMPYTVCAIVFIIAFALHNDGITTICFLSIENVQVSRQTGITRVSDASFFVELGHCAIVHHPSCCKRASSYTGMVDPSRCSTFDPSILRDFNRGNRRIE